MDGQRLSLNSEREVAAVSGWIMLPVVIIILLAGITLLVVAAVLGDDGVLSTGAIWSLVGPGLFLLTGGLRTSSRFLYLGA